MVQTHGLGNRPHPALIPLLAVTMGTVVVNLYYAQPLSGAIGLAGCITPNLAGLITSLTQIGYGVSLFSLVPLTDPVENKRLVLIRLH